jgi:hypothetical protein
LGAAAGGTLGTESNCSEEQSWSIKSGDMKEVDMGVILSEISGKLFGNLVFIIIGHVGAIGTVKLL